MALIKTPVEEPKEVKDTGTEDAQRNLKKANEDSGVQQVYQLADSPEHEPILETEDDIVSAIQTSDETATDEMKRAMEEQTLSVIKQGIEDIRYQPELDNEPTYTMDGFEGTMNQCQEMTHEDLWTPQHRREH